MHSVLFICTANVCRSPLAEGLLRDRVKDSAEAWRIESAGTWALEGDSYAETTLRVLNERNIDLAGHFSRQVTGEMLKEFQLILTMEEGHKEALRFEFPEAAGRIYLLSEMIGQRYSIRDPMGRPLPEFLATAQEMERIFEKGFEKIARLSKVD